MDKDEWMKDATNFRECISKLPVPLGARDLLPVSDAMIQIEGKDW